MHHDLAPGNGGPAVRIAWLTDRHPELTATYIWREAEALRAAGVGVDAFSVWRPAPAETLAGDELARTSYLDDASPIAGLRAHAVLLAASPARYLRALRLALRTRPSRPGGFRRALACLTWAVLLARALRARGLTHVHNHGTDTSCTVAMLASALGGIDFSFSVHGPRSFFAVKARHLDEKLRHARFVRCISRFCRSQCLLWVAPDRWDRLYMLHGGVDPKAYAGRVHEGVGTHLLFVGRPGIPKGLPFLVEALARLCPERPDLRVTIIGDDPERAAVERSVRAAGLTARVHFTGYQTATQVAGWLARADLLVLPSLAEGVPVVLMEAMAAGVPVVATSIAGTGELVTDGVSGFLVPPADPDALVDRIRRLLDDPQLRARMGRAGRETVVRDFNLGRQAAQLRRLLAAVVLGQALPSTLEPHGAVEPPRFADRVRTAR